MTKPVLSILYRIECTDASLQNFLSTAVAVLRANGFEVVRQQDESTDNQPRILYMSSASKNKAEVRKILDEAFGASSKTTITIEELVFHNGTIV